VRFATSIQAGLACVALIGIAGCTTGSLVDTLAIGPQLPDAEVASAEPVTEMGYAGPAVDSEGPGLLAGMASAMRPEIAPAPSGAGASMDALIARYSAEYGVPVALVHRVVKRESTYNPQARNGGHYGLMQIKPETARTMGYRGDAAGLYDAHKPEIRREIPARRVAARRRQHDRAVQLYCIGLLLRGEEARHAGRDRPAAGLIAQRLDHASIRWPGL
jgi:hypothetical protein